MVAPPRLVLVLGDQLSPAMAALRAADPARDIVVMAEVMAEATDVPHHPQKIVLILAAMRHFAQELRAAGWRVAYSTLDDPDNTHTIAGELIRRAAESGAQEVIATKPGDWRLIAALGECPLPVRLLPDDRFLCPEADFARWAEGRKTLRMEWFYRDMRRRTGLMMEGDAPAGGRWNFDAENRKPARADLWRRAPLRFAPDGITRAVIDLVAARFAGRFGRLEGFAHPVTRADAEAAWEDFVRHRLPRFGAEQDAMLAGDPFLSHALISAPLNLGLLEPLALCRRVEAEWRAGRVPIEAAEGFIRQIIGWREFVRGIWAISGPGYLDRNALGAARPLPAVYWGGPTRMACMAAAVGQTRDLAYAHHIQRLMVLANYGLIAGLDPQAFTGWFHRMFVDGYDWVMQTNVLGMGLFADGGLLASKPYAASGNYINRMSTYCKGCRYNPKQRTGPTACPFNALYWDFLSRHAETLRRNPRMGLVMKQLEKIPNDELVAIRSAAAAHLGAEACPG